MGGDPHHAPEQERRRRQLARFGAVFFSAAAGVTVLGLLLPHQPQVDETGLEIVAWASAALAVSLSLWGERAPGWIYMLVVAAGTALVSLALISNGERHGGGAGGDEMYYLWVVLYGAYFFGRLATTLQVGFVAVAYAITLAIVDPGDVATSRWLSTIGLVVGTAVVVRFLSERIDSLMASLGAAAHTDCLTGLANRLAFEDAFAREAARSAREGEGFALLLADLDRLKEINDRFGHHAGDEAICDVARALRETLRSGDFAARIGGDEFAVLLPRTRRSGAERVGERLSHVLCERAPAERSLGLSFGVAQPGEDGMALDDVMRAADAALYSAKKANIDAAARGPRARRAPTPATPG